MSLTLKSAKQIALLDGTAVKVVSVRRLSNRSGVDNERKPEPGGFSNVAPRPFTEIPSWCS